MKWNQTSGQKSAPPPRILWEAANTPLEGKSDGTAEHILLGTLLKSKQRDSVNLDQISRNCASTKKNFFLAGSQFS